MPLNKDPLIFALQAVYRARSLQLLWRCTVERELTLNKKRQKESLVLSSDQQAAALTQRRSEFVHLVLREFQHVQVIGRLWLHECTASQSLRKLQAAMMEQFGGLLRYVAAIQRWRRSAFLDATGKIAIQEHCKAQLKELQSMPQRILETCPAVRADPESAGRLRVLMDATATLVRKDRETFYEPVSDAEKRAIFDVMSRDVGSGMGGFGGHWYQCNNGHVYTIGECGGAMEQSRCPECGVPVGGGQHRLEAGNRPANEFLRSVHQSALVVPDGWRAGAEVNMHIPPEEP